MVATSLDVLRNVIGIPAYRKAEKPLDCGIAKPSPPEEMNAFMD